MGNIFLTPTAEKVARGHNLEGKVAVVTGASSGIGLETTRSLAKRGALVFMCCRTLQSGTSAKTRLLDQIGKRFEPNLRVHEMELSSFESIRSFVVEFIRLELPLDYLVLNAAVMGVPFQRTKEGFEMHFGVNFLAHFHLTHLLLPVMRAHPERESRIVAVCCATKTTSKLKLTKLNPTRKKYDRFKAYDRSKLALKYFIEELSMRSKGSNIYAVGADPGSTDTWIFKNLGPIVLSLMAFARIFMNSPQQGAATVLFACLDRKILTKSRCHCRHVRISRLSKLRSYRESTLPAKLYTMSHEMIESAEVNSFKEGVFDPTKEIWKSMKTMFTTMTWKRNLLNNKKYKSPRSRPLTHLSYKKLE